MPTKLSTENALKGLVAFVGAVAAFLIVQSPDVFDKYSIAVTLIFITISLVVVYLKWKKEGEKTALAEQKIERIETKAEKEPEKTKFAWDLARVKLEAYFDRNLSQVRMIFYVAVGVMVIGFAFILWGVSIAIRKPEFIKTSYIAAISGIITEFIGVTFMVIYRSTMTQANQFMEVLERINTVGMAVQILDAIPEKDTELKNSTRAEIVSLLLSVNSRTRKPEIEQRLRTSTK